MNTNEHQLSNNSLASPLQQLLHAYRNASLTEREKGTYFEELPPHVTTDGKRLESGKHKVMHHFFPWNSLNNTPVFTTHLRGALARTLSMGAKEARPRPGGQTI